MPGTASSDLLPGRVLSGRYLLHDADRHRRERSCLRCRRPAAAPPRRGQGAARGARRRRRVPPALPGRGPTGGVAAPPQHRHGLRLGRGRRAVHGPRAARGRQPPVDARPGHPADRRPGRPDRPRRRVGAGVRARARRAAPRREARQPPVRRARRRARRRLRARTRPGRGELDRTRGRACSAPRATRHPSRRRVCSSTRAPTCTRSRSCSSKRSPAACRSRPTRRSARSPRARSARWSRRQELGSLAPVIDRAGRLEPDDRYPDAATMRQALADVGETLPPPGPLVLAGMVDHADPHPTRIAAPREAAAVRPGRRRRAAPARGPAGHRRPQPLAFALRRAAAGWCRSSSRS